MYYLNYHYHSLLFLMPVYPFKFIFYFSILMSLMDQTYIVFSWSMSPSVWGCHSVVLVAWFVPVPFVPFVRPYWGVLVLPHKPTIRLLISGAVSCLNPNLYVVGYVVPSNSGSTNENSHWLLNWPSIYLSLCSQHHHCAYTNNPIVKWFDGKYIFLFLFLFLYLQLITLWSGIKQILWQ